jgi:transposase
MMKIYDHYIALDWAQSNMALAHVRQDSDEIQTIDVRSDIKALKDYLARLKGKKVLTFEESNPAQWLYTELVSEVNEIIVCEPYSNHLLKNGPKTDRVDAIKLLRLLRADMLKPVFHCTSEFVRIRKLVSGHEDLTYALVKIKNQRSALFRAVGKKPGVASDLESAEERFVVESLDRQIASLHDERLRYEVEFRNIRRRNKMVRDLQSIPGIGPVNSVKIAAIVIDPKRFAHKTAFWLYCGLQKYELISGGRSYGKRSPRFSRRLKAAFKLAALTAVKTNADNPLKKYYQDLIEIKKYPEHQARHAVARRIAALALGVMRRGEELNFEELNQKKLAS